MNNAEFGNISNEKDTDQFIAIRVTGIPEIKKDDDIGEIVFKRSQVIGGLLDNDVIAVASKIVSKAEGKVIDISQVNPSDKAKELSKITRKKAQVCQIILDESSNYIVRGHTIIAHHKLGYILTSAGVDQIDESHVSLIPHNPDSSAKIIREKIEKLSNKKIAVVITDSEGREDRAGAGAIALGVSGIDPLRKTASPSGKIQEETISDMVANAASILIGQRGKNTPVVILRGLGLQRNVDSKMQDYLRK